ncbi:MAG: hypothetical protein C0404_11445 [Verrucomicrobia bacterium]|nr:hypothetical protein [Verrucomicrobiota bacterium]
MWLRKIATDPMRGLERRIQALLALASLGDFSCADEVRRLILDKRCDKEGAGQLRQAYSFE